MGDANFCARKWNDPKFTHRNIAIHLKNMIQQCDLQIHDVGLTYLADHAQSNNEIAQSALDHVYSSKRMCQYLEVRKLGTSSSDHVPVIVNFKTNKFFC